MLKPNQVRIRLYADDEEVVRRISEQTRLSSTDVVSMILHAALRSIEENGGQFPMPLRFAIGGTRPKGDGMAGSRPKGDGQAARGKADTLVASRVKGDGGSTARGKSKIRTRNE